MNSPEQHQISKTEIQNDKQIHKGYKTICVPCTCEVYKEVSTSFSEFRPYIDDVLGQFPDLFPQEIESGYFYKDSRESSKAGIRIYRIELKQNGEAYSLRPSFIMPYMTGLAKDVEHALFFRKFSVPFWALTHVFGRDPMYWYRIERALGRNSLVGTTVRSSENLPKNVLADEKHTRDNGEKVYLATTVGDGCILGAAIAETAGEEDLTKAYSTFHDEAKDIDPNYAPDTVNTDGWKPTQKAWKTLFPLIDIIICFLHAFLKIRDRAKKKHHDQFMDVSEKVWNVYHAPDKKSFSQRMRRLKEWTLNNVVPDIIKEKVLDLCDKRSLFAKAYDHPKSHRTSNMLDRLMRMMDRHLFNMQYFHGNITSAETSMRANALIFNFCPSCPQTIKKHDGKISPAERLNGFRYHDNWLQNLLLSASLAGWRSVPQNPL